MNSIKMLTLGTLASLFLTTTTHAQNLLKDNYYWLKISAKNKFERTTIANAGVAIDIVRDDYVIVYADEPTLKTLQKTTKILSLVNLQEEEKLQAVSPLVKKTSSFPAGEDQYSTYAELTTELKKLADENPTFVTLKSIATTIDQHEMWALRISTEQSTASQKPGVIYLGGHHAREHLSVDVPLKWAQYLVNEYKANNPDVVRLVQSRDIHIIPAVNPDGLEYDISGPKYKLWRKNRSTYNEGIYGVDLNRNYGYLWGTGGSSTNPANETYRGPAAFSEIESTAIKNYIEANTNITVLQTTHTFSKLILYPWGHTYDSIDNEQQKLVHEKMAEHMSKWNGYKPEQSSDLYITSGDTTDWSFGVHKIISFTFELDPSGYDFETSPGLGLGDILNSKCEQRFSPACGGFYPGESFIQTSFDKNLKPFMFLLEYADNPYRFLSENP